MICESGPFYRAMAGRLGSVCVAFRGEIGGQCGCSIYQLRPQGCRRFEVGSVLCRKSREEAGLPV